MLVIRVVSFKGRPVDKEILARFGEAGGTIGRGENSTLVLPDPDRYISRTHASISFQAGGFVITDTGAKNPIFLNGRAMGPGSQTRIGDGTEIRLGDYVLEATMGPSDAPHRAVAPTVVAGAIAPLGEDPFARVVRPQDKLPDPFADLSKPPAPRPQPLIPLDEDWMKPPSRDAVVPPAGSPARSDPLADLRGREPKVDDILGLKSAPVADLLGPEVPPGTPRHAGPLLPDPLDLLGVPRRPVPPPTVPDQGQEVFTPYAPPVARPDPRIEAKAEPAPPPAAPAAPGPPEPAAPRLAPGDLSAVSGTALLRAFLEGAGVPEAQVPGGLTPEAMDRVGKLLRAAVRGTLDLLRARGLTKSEMRLDLTAITPRDNNPLKFSPTPEAALAHLLAPHVPGFMESVRAMQEAYDDLRAHQLGFLAGMRAALDEVLARFAPEEIEKRLPDRSVLDGMLPMNRKAKQWDLFVERYEDIAAQARDDFDAILGKAFRRAYEAQVKQLRSESRQR